MTKQDVKAAWSKVGDELSSLGLKLKYHVEQEFADSDDDVKSALDRLADAVDDAVEAAENAVTDPAVKEDLHDTGRKLVDAISTTVLEASKEVRASMPS